MTEKFREAASRMKTAVAEQYAARDKAWAAWEQNANGDPLAHAAFNAGWAARKAAQYESLLDKPKATCDREALEWAADAKKQGK